MKKLSTVLLTLVFAFSFSIASVSAAEDEVTGEETPVEEGITPAAAEDFDTTNFIDFVTEGIKQGYYIDIADFYYGLGEISVTVDPLDTEKVELDGTEMTFIAEGGTVTFTVTDGESVWGPFTANIIANPVTAITFDKTEATVTVGEYVDFYFEYLPEDGWLVDDVELLASLDGTGEADIEVIPDPENEGFIIGYRVYGVTAGTLTLTVEATNMTTLEELIPGTATITIVEPEDTTPVEPPVAPVEDVPADVVPTGDTTMANTYSMLAVLSVAALGYLVYSNKKASASK